jgi:hypothetical protein
VTIGQSLSETVTGLDPGTTYYFNAQARNSAGESDWGNEQSFTTSAVTGLPNVSTYGAGQVTGTSAVLEAGLADDGGEGCDCRFRYWIPGASPTTTSWESGFHSGDTFSRRVTGLRPGCQYSFQAQAMNSAGESEWGSEQGFSTGPVVSQTLLVSASPGGSVISPGEGTFVFSTGETVGMEAVPQDARHEFARWSGTTVDNGLVQDPSAAKTTLLVDGDRTLQAVFNERGRVALGFSLGDIGMDDPQQFDSRIASNNRPGATFVERVTDQMADPNGYMQMQVIGTESAQAKGRFGRCAEDRVLMRFKYLFDSEDVELVVYLSNTPQVGNRDPIHVREVARILPPPMGRPASPGSPYWAAYEGWVSTGGLDLGQGTWAELELAPKAGYSVQTSMTYWPSLAGSFTTSEVASRSANVDDWSVAVACSGICMDLNGDTAVDAEDFLMIPAACGCQATRLEGGRCFEGVFSRDGYIDHMDMVSDDWTFRSNCLNMCRAGDLPLWQGSGTSGGSSSVLSSGGIDRPPGTQSTAQGVSASLVILGKRQMGDSMDNVLKDGLYGLGLDGTYAGTIGGGGLSDRCQVRLVRSTGGQVCLVNSLQGVVDLTGQVLLGVRQLQVGREPRYGQSATLDIGIHGTGDQAYGRPVLDAAITDAHLYVAPVVVIPQTADPYLAAAEISRTDYSVQRIYDDSKAFDPLHPDNPSLTGIREIKVDGNGNVYVLNVQQINRSTMLWKYDSYGALVRKVCLDDLGIVDPVGLCLSRDGRSLYLGMGQYGVDTSETWIYALATQDLSLSKKIEVKGLQRTTSITEDGAGVLWVAGFNLDRIDSKLDPSNLPGYAPILARIEPDQTKAEATAMAGAAGDLALPVSIVWTGK